MKNFESRLEKLEELADRIREPDLPLEEAMAVFEEGIKLSKGLERDLEKVQGKVEILLDGPGETAGKPSLGLFGAEEEKEED